MEYCTEQWSRRLIDLNLADIKKACIQACLEAMIDERRFTYTDCFVFGAVKR